MKGAPSRILERQRAVAAGRTSHEREMQIALSASEAPESRCVYTRLYREQALALARAADSKTLQPAAGPLAGVPISIKDLFDVAGEVTTAGSKVCEDEPPAAIDADAVARLRVAGAALTGRTQMSEFAFSGVGTNPHWGTPTNPADERVARIPGGSSSGAAVSVARGLALAALGTDTGGSIRIPAALCGLVGFKSSQHRVSRRGVLPLSDTLDSVGSIAHTVTDNLLLDGVLSGQPLQVRPRRLHGMRLLVPLGLMLESLEPAVARAFEQALHRLSEGGADIVSQAAPLLDQAPRINGQPTFAAIEAYAVHRERLHRARGRFDPRIAERIEGGASVLACDYIVQQQARCHWASQVQDWLQGFDAWICPTVPLLAPAIADLAEDARFFDVNRLLLRNPSVVNLTGGCAWSLPCQPEAELPVGLMLARGRGEDAELAAVALAVEAALRR